MKIKIKKSIYVVDNYFSDVDIQIIAE